MDPLPPVEAAFGTTSGLKKMLMKNVAEVFLFRLFSVGVTLRNTAVLLHSGRFLNVGITAVA